MNGKAKSVSLRSLELLIGITLSTAAAVGLVWKLGGRDATAAARVEAVVTEVEAVSEEVEEHVADQEHHFSRQDAERLKGLEMTQEALIGDVDDIKDYQLEMRGDLKELLRRTP